MEDIAVLEDSKKKKGLPDGWNSASLEVLLDRITNGSSLTQHSETSSDSEEVFYPITRIETIALGSINLERVKYVKNPSEKELEKYALQKGDILLSHINSDKHLGKTAIFNLDETVIHGVNLLLLRSNNAIDSFFLNYQFQFLRGIGKFIEVAQRAVNQSSINQKKLNAFNILLPPYPEQKRIVAKLDALLEKAEAAQERLEAIPETLKQFRQRVLAHAVSGKLTEDWRSENVFENTFKEVEYEEMRETKISLPESWLWLPLSGIAKVKSNLVEPLDYLELPLIAPDNIQAETGTLMNKPLVSDIMPKSAKHYFEEGCIVYSKIRPYLSKLIIADFNGLCSADMYPITTDLDIKYLYFYMLSNSFLSFATTAGERSVLPKINQKGLGIIPVSVPPLEEQKEIARKVEELYAWADEVEEAFERAMEKLEKLPQALLTKAFRGELVPQDPADEPASELLERIKAERLKQQKGKSRKGA